MSLGAPPNAPKHTCPKHQSTALIWVPCGGNENSFCRLTLQVTDNDDNLLSFIATYKGSHGHEKPPAKFPHPSSIKLMKEMIQTNPQAGAAQLRMGVDGQSSLPEVDDDYNVRRYAIYFHVEQQKNCFEVCSAGRQLTFYCTNLHTRGLAALSWPKRYQVLFLQFTGYSHCKGRIWFGQSSLKEMLRKSNKNFKNY